MATISENLQIIKDSTDAIKQAIIDKGGTIEGDISTWADAISGIETGGGSSESEYIFTGTLTHNITKVVVTGSLNKVPDTGHNYLLALGWYIRGLCYGSYFITNTGPYTLSVDFDEPISSNEIPAMCILNTVENTFTLIPVKFIQQTQGDMSEGNPN